MEVIQSQNVPKNLTRILMGGVRYHESEHHFLSYPFALKAPLSLHSLKFCEDPPKFIFESQSVRSKFIAWIYKNGEQLTSVD
jgi:hypothetical protein